MQNPLSNKLGWIGMPEDELKGFSSQRGATRDITGVNIWSDIFLYDIERPRKATEKLAIVLIDTRELFSAKTSPTDNNRIFALATLISSIQIFNLNDVIQENHLEYLQFATSYAQIKTNMSSGDNHKHFQSILFLMQNWVNPEDFAFGYDGGREYIHEVLLKNKYQSRSLQQIREYIRNSFESIDCFLMPHPGNSVLNNDFNGSFVSMSPNFKTNLKTLIEELLKPANLVKKRIFGQLVNGKEFGAYTKMFFEQLQSSETPQIITIYDQAIEKQMNNTLDEAMKKFQDGFHVVSFNRTREDFANSLDIMYREGKETALNWFVQAKKMGTKEHEEKYKIQLINRIDSISAKLKFLTLNEYDTEHRPSESQIISLYEHTIEKQIKIYLDLVIQNYKIEVNHFIDFNRNREDFANSLDIIYRGAKETALNWFVEVKKMGTKEHEDKYKDKLIKKIESYNTVWRKTMLDTYDTIQISDIE